MNSIMELCLLFPQSTNIVLVPHRILKSPFEFRQLRLSENVFSTFVVVVIVQRVKVFRSVCLSFKISSRVVYWFSITPNYRPKGIIIATVSYIFVLFVYMYHKYGLLMSGMWRNSDMFCRWNHQYSSQRMNISITVQRLKLWFSPNLFSIGLFVSWQVGLLDQSSLHRWSDGADGNCPTWFI